MAQFHYFLFDKNLGKGVVQTHTFIGGLGVNTFSLLLPGIIDIYFPLTTAYPNGKVPINCKKMGMIQKSSKYVLDDEEFQIYWNEICVWPTTDARTDDS